MEHYKSNWKAYLHSHHNISSDYLFKNFNIAILETW